MQQIFFTSSRQKSKINSNINITPLVDVMLVLLIIFMVTAPMMIGGVDINLPKTSASTQAKNTTPLVISINSRGQVFLMNTKIKRTKLAKKLQNIAKERGSYGAIFIKGDARARYDEIIKTIAEVQKGGFENISLISEIGDDNT